jgi:hypothetical protein
VAAKLAQDFNKEIVSAALSAIKVKYLVARIARLPQPDGTHRFMFVEKKYRAGSSDWIKYKTNSGHFVRSMKGLHPKHAEYQQLLIAFSHYTYQHTKGYLLVCDLQGVETVDGRGAKTLLLTDPAIHCQQLRFGRTNLREKGIQSFFKTHKCNKYCKGLGLGMPTFDSA